MHLYVYICIFLYLFLSIHTPANKTSPAPPPIATIKIHGVVGQTGLGSDSDVRWR